MREIRTSSSMSGVWKRSTARLVRHRRPKGPDTEMPGLNHRATPRLYGAGSRRWRRHVRAGATLGSARRLVPLVKWRVNARIRRNCNGVFILNNDHVIIAVGFARRIFGIVNGEGREERRKG